MIKSTTRFVSLAALFLIPFFPLIVADSLFFPFITGKAFHFRILVEIGFAAYAVLAFMDARYRPKWNPLTLAVTAFALIVLVADLVGVNPLRSLWSNFERMEGWLVIAHLWAFYIMASGLLGSDATGKYWKAWMNVFILVGTIVGIYGIVQLAGGATIHQGSRIDASLGNAAYLAVYMLMNIGFALYLFFETKRRSSESSLRYLYAILAIFFAFILFETATRGTFLGLIGGTMLTLLIHALFAKKSTKKSRYISGGVIVGIILLGVIFWANRDASFIQKNEALRRIATISINDVTTQARGYIWPMAITGFTERPVLGWGQENFNYIFNANYRPEMWSQEQWFDRAHNVYLDWLVAGGIVGLISYLLLYVFALRAVWKSSIPFSEKSVLTGLLAAYAVHNVFVFDNLASYVAFFALLSFIGSHVVGESKKSRTKEISMDIVEYVVLPVSVVLLLGALYFLNIRVIQANRSLIAALHACNSTSPDAGLFQKVFDSRSYIALQETREQLVTCTSGLIRNSLIPQQKKEEMFQMAVLAIENQIAATPKDARMYVIGGQFLNSAGQAGPAAMLLEQAHLLSPRKQSIHFELANNYVNNGQIEKGVQLLKEAYELAPNYPVAQTSYAMGLILTGREAMARELFRDHPEIFTSEQAAQVYSSQTVKRYDQALQIYAALVAKSPEDFNLKARMAQVQYAAGRKADAVATLRGIEKDHPEFKPQIEQAIKEIQQ